MAMYVLDEDIFTGSMVDIACSTSNVEKKKVKKKKKYPPDLARNRNQLNKVVRVSFLQLSSPF